MGAYSDALTPVFLYVIPLVVPFFVLLLFVKHGPLRTTTSDDHVDTGAALKIVESTDPS